MHHEAVPYMLRPLVPGTDTGIYVVAGTPFLYLEDSFTLVMADLHLGFEEAASRGLVYSLRKTGGYPAVFIPRIQLRKTVNMLKGPLNALKVKRVIINGDLKHAFDRLLRQEREEVTELVKFLRENNVEEIVVVRGNHDNFVKPILLKLGVDFVNGISTVTRGKRVLFVHGHENVDLSEQEIVVIGHEHPSLKCFDVYRFPCYMKIPLPGGRMLVVMPATGPYHPGVVVTLTPSEYLSPLIRRQGSLKSMIITTWIDLGEVSPRSVEYFETPELVEYIRVDRLTAGSREYAIIEFRNYDIAQLLCRL
ncbi:MAG: metallophosphoesterase [Desulfurococcaceae archaeon]